MMRKKNDLKIKEIRMRTTKERKKKWMLRKTIVRKRKRMIKRKKEKLNESKDARNLIRNDE